MSMDTFALLDDPAQCSLRSDITLYEMYKTRLLRVDQAPRIRQDPLQRYIHQILRWLRYSRMSNSSQENGEDPNPGRIHEQRPYQNTALISDIISRVIVGMLTAIFLIVPLIALSFEPRKGIQIVIVSVCILAFACLVSITLRASNLEMIIVSSAYAAIISVFVSNGASCT